MKTIRQLRSQGGVAMVTVLLVAAVLTVVSSTAAFVTIKEFSATGDDLKAARALSYAEAGIDRALHALRSGIWNWDEIVMAGCSTTEGAPKNYPVVTSAYDADSVVLAGSVGSGDFEVRIERDKAGNDVACPSAVPGIDEPQRVWITSEGTHPAALRRVRQEIEVEEKGLPIGLYAEESVSAGGTGDVTDISLVTPGDINNRERISFVGYDPHYTIGKFFPDDDPLDRYAPGFFDNTDRALQIPSAAHAGGTIRRTNGTVEHPNTAPNCTFNGANGETGQSVWDGSVTAPSTQLASGCAWTGNPAFTGSPAFPPTANFREADARRIAPTPQLDPEDYDFLKDAAETRGLYCSYLGGSNQPDFCTGAGDTPNGQLIDDDDLPADDGTNVVVYIDFPSGSNPGPDSAQQSITWQTKDGELCDDGGRSVILVVRNGSVKLANGAVTHGAIFAPEGTVEAVGDHLTEGSIIARVIRLGGNGEFELTDCAIEASSFVFMRVTALNWRELDR